MAQTALTQERIFHHVRQGRRDGKCQLERDPLVLQAIKKLDEGDIGLGDGLEKPALFEKTIVLRMTYIRKMCVQNQQQITLRHGAPQKQEITTESQRTQRKTQKKSRE